MSKMPKVSFGFVNCNRLHYLRSCLESLLVCTEDYENKEIIIVDNASTEEGTDEYLEELKERGFSVFRQEARDPSNEYAKALNIIAENATGKYVAPIPADIQFVVKGGWLKEYIEFLEQYEDTNDFKFLYHFNRNPVMGAMNCMISKSLLDKIYPWDIQNDNHEGGGDSETKMLEKIAKIVKSEGMQKFYAAPSIPVAVGIFNEQGGNARVRGNMRFGEYWSPPADESGVSYYKIHSFEEVMKKFGPCSHPVAIEDITEAVGWKLPIDSSGAWIKLKDSPDIKSVEI